MKINRYLDINFWYPWPALVIDVDHPSVAISWLCWSLEVRW